MNIREFKQGLRQALSFTSSQGVDGRMTFDNEGFAFNKQVSQETIVPLVYADTLTINCRFGNIFTVTLTGNTTINLVNAEVGVITLVVKQDAVGGRTVTFPDGYLVVSTDGAPDFSGDAASVVNVISILFDGTDYYVSAGKNFVAVSTL